MRFETGCIIGEPQDYGEDQMNEKDDDIFTHQGDNQTFITPDHAVDIALRIKHIEITEKGIPVNIQVEKSSNKELDDELIAMIREWRFKAALRGDVPVASQAYIDLSLGDPLPRENGRLSRKKE